MQQVTRAARPVVPVTPAVVESAANSHAVSKKELAAVAAAVLVGWIIVFTWMFMFICMVNGVRTLAGALFPSL